MTIPKIVVGKCIDCGKELHMEYCGSRDLSNKVPANYRSFNDGKILRCLECCEKQNIPHVFIKSLKGSR